MVVIGKKNILHVVEGAPQGVYLDGGELGPILLPRRYIATGVAPGGDVEVFIYRDSEDRLVATTETPLAMVGECAVFEVVGSDPNLGAFLKWGLSKDLLVPRREQAYELQPGDRAVAYVSLDEQTGRIVASTRLRRHLHLTPPPFAEDQCVSLLIAEETELGYLAVIENTHLGLLYYSDLGSPLAFGQRLEGYIREIRPDGKIDLSLDRTGRGRVPPLAQQIADKLRASAGFLPFNDETPPGTIRTEFGVSKKAFKQALGALYKERRIRFENGGIRLAVE